MKTEQNNFEQQVSQKLEQRTIVPSAQAWDRLDAMLSVAEEKDLPAKKPNRSWLYMAACFGILFIAGAFFISRQNTNGIINNKGVVIEENANTEKAEQPQNTINPVVNASPVTASQQNRVAQVAISKQEVKPDNTDKTQEATQPEVVNTVTVIPQQAIAENNPDNKIQVNAAALLASVENESFQQELTVNNVAQNKTHINVNANALLSSTEGELNESFRSKALQKVVKNFNEVKSAVANRNHN